MPNSLELWLIRHGETAWSLSGQHSGRHDLPLTPHGEDEARQTAHALRGVAFDLVFCSTLQRARRTCEIAGFLDQATLDPSLQEWDYGDCTGYTRAQLAERFPNWSIWDGPVPNGESIEAVAARAREVIARLRARSGRIALFAHGHFLRIFATQFLGIPPQHGRHLALHTASVSILGFDDGYPAIQAWNRK
ncbi:MAG: histidine phosphatase family protein [Acidobacteria bacterium]|nr:histidine phosphatase family protein [Acidobacteriota bacterium]